MSEINFQKLEECRITAIDALNNMNNAYIEQGFVLVWTGSYPDISYWFLHKSLKEQFDLRRHDCESEEWFKSGRSQGLIQKADVT